MAAKWRTRALRLWGWAEHGQTVAQYAQWVLGAKVIMGPLGAVGGLVLAVIQSHAPLLLFFTGLGGLALGLFVANEIEGRRLQQRRLALAEGIPAPSPISQEGGHASDALVEQQAKEPGRFLWATLRAVQSQDGGKTWVSVTLVSCLLRPLPFVKVSGVLRYDGQEMANFDFPESNKEIPEMGSMGKWTGSVIARGDAIPEGKEGKVTLDLKLWLNVGEITIPGIPVASPTNG